MLKRITIIIFLLNALTSYPQKGNIFLFDYEISLPNLNYHNVSCIQTNNGLMLFANPKGVLSFDGLNWKLIKTPGTPYSLAVSETGSIYVGCNNSFGVLNKSNKNEFTYQSLSDSSSLFSEVEKIIVSESHIVFYSTNAVFIYNEIEKEIEEALNKEEKKFSGIFLFNKDIYINSENVLTKINIKNPKEIKSLRIPKLYGKSIVADCRFNDEMILLGLNDNSVLKYDGKGLLPFVYEGKGYVQGNILGSIIELNSRDLVISTLSGGCIIIDRNSGKTKSIINYQTGLPDDEVLSMGIDNHGGLWICNEYRITRADLKLPVKSFSGYPGLDGIISSISKLGDTLFVSSSEGLFYLGKVQNLEEVEHFIKKEHKKTTQIQRFQIIKTVNKLIELSFLNEEDSLMEVREIPVEIEIPVDSVATSVRDVFFNREMRKSYALQSMPFVFKKVKGVKGKCRHTVNYKEFLLVGTNIGLFLINQKLGVKQIIKDKYINFVCPSENYEGLFYVATEDGLIVLNENNGKWNYSEQKNIKKGIHSIAEEKSRIWIGSQNEVIKAELNEKGKITGISSYKIDHNFEENIIVKVTQFGTIFFSSSGVYEYKDGKISSIEYFNKLMNSSSRIIYKQSGHTWLVNDFEWINISSKETINEDKLSYLSLFMNVDDIYFDLKENIWVVDDNSIFLLESNASIDTSFKFRVRIENVKDKNDNGLNLNELSLKYNNSSVKILIAGDFLLREKCLFYQHRLFGVDNNWSAWHQDPEISYPYLPPGSYILEVRGKNLFGQKSNIIQYEIRVEPPFWKSWWFITITILIGVGIIFLISWFRIQQLKRAKRILEQKVKEATAEIVKQKDELEVAYHQIELKNEHITDSINYAQQIQTAILPDTPEINKLLDNALIFFKPRDIVSGDFYWFMDSMDMSIIIAADCTGHGVPGAFMSMIGNTLLNQIIKEMNIYDPGEILTNLDNEVVLALKQDYEDSTSRDGMDISICTIYKKDKKIAFAGAHNPLYYIIDEELNVIDADSYSIGGVRRSHVNKTFTTKYLPLAKKPMTCYLFSDGFMDQNGGADNKKFRSARFKELLLEVNNMEPETQYNILDKTLKEWMGDKPQRDDIIVIGFKI